MPTLLHPIHVARRTLGRAVSCSGIGLHGGQAVNVRLSPARGEAGVVFRRVDLPGAPAIPATVASVSEVDHATTLAVGAVRVRTVEHLLAALAGLEVSSCVVEVDSDELPIFDGSATRWVSLLRHAGTQPLARSRSALRLLEPVHVASGASSISAYPADALRITCSIDFPHPVIGAQELDVEVTPETFADELAAARTFGFLADVEQLRRAGLVRGGSLENAIVLDDRAVVTGPLRWEDEFVRHKALDLVGDLALLGAPLLAHVVAHRAGHRLHVELCRRILALPERYRLEDAGGEHAEAGPALARSAIAPLGVPAHAYLR